MAIQQSWFVPALLVSQVSLATIRGHQAEVRRGDLASGDPEAFRAFGRDIAVFDAAVQGKRTARATLVFVGGHRDEAGSRFYLASARSILPSNAFFGPAALGRMSNEKISVGTYNVAQALGISTMPLMWPSTGAVPRIA